MKRRHRPRLLLNACSLIVLAFSLYLNFFRKEVPEISLMPNTAQKEVPKALAVKDQQHVSVAHK